MSNGVMDPLRANTKINSLAIYPDMQLIISIGQITSPTFDQT